MNTKWVEREEMVASLSQATQAAGGVKPWASVQQTSASYVYEILRGTRDPGPAILRSLGLERVIVYRPVSA